MKLVLMLSVAGLLLSQDRLDKPPAKPAKAPDLTAILVEQWNAANQRAASQENETKDLALRLQSSHIQLRETKLQMKEFEAKLAALLCEKGTMLVMGSPPKCEALKEK